MPMNRQAVLVLLVALLAAASLPAARKAATPPLDEKYRNWQDLVEYISTPEERAVFLRLDNDRDRDAFIKMFWKQRDPTPGTEENEYQQEHIKRFNYANQYYKYGSARAGWKTDQGRIYILLGPPQSTDRYESELDVYPVQIWSYSGTPAQNLPLAFWVVFWKRGDAGEYKLYDPIGVGPHALIRKNQNINPDDYETIYKTLSESHDILALAAFSLLPDEITFNGAPSMLSSTVLAHIFEVPLTQLSSSAYATQFLKYKGVVNVEYANNYVESKHAVLLLRDPHQRAELHPFRHPAENGQRRLSAGKGPVFHQFQTLPQPEEERAERRKDGL